MNRSQEKWRLDMEVKAWVARGNAITKCPTQFINPRLHSIEPTAYKAYPTEVVALSLYQITGLNRTDLAAALSTTTGHLTAAENRKKIPSRWAPILRDLASQRGVFDSVIDGAFIKFEGKK